MKADTLHIHRRKRVHQKKYQPYPHPNPRMRLLDDIVMGVAIIAPLTTLPQLYMIWIEKNAAGISLLTWGLYDLLAIPLLIYGIAHKEKQLIVMHSLWILINTMVVIGTLIYQ